MSIAATGEPLFYATLYWKYSVMRALIVPMFKMQDLLKEAYQAVEARGSTFMWGVLKNVYGDKVPPALKDGNYEFVDAVVQEAILRAQTYWWVQKRLIEPSMARQNEELVQVWRNYTRDFLNQGLQ